MKELRDCLPRWVQGRKASRLHRDVLAETEMSRGVRRAIVVAVIPIEGAVCVKMWHTKEIKMLITIFRPMPRIVLDTEIYGAE